MEWSANVSVIARSHGSERHCVELGVCALGILGIALQERCPVRGCVRTPGLSDHGRLRARAFAVASVGDAVRGGVWPGTTGHSDRMKSLLKNLLNEEQPRTRESRLVLSVPSHRVLKMAFNWRVQVPLEELLNEEEPLHSSNETMFRNLSIDQRLSDRMKNILRSR